MNLQWTFVDRRILDKKDPDLLKSWVEDEEKICATYILYICVVTALVSWVFFALDHSRSTFNLDLGLWHRGGMCLLSVLLSAAIKFKIGKSLPYPFALYKILFALTVLYVCVFQNVLMFRDQDIPRLYSPTMLVLAVWGADVGHRSTSVFCLMHALALLITGLAFHGFSLWPGFVNDFSFEIIAIFITFTLSSRYSLKVESKISHWESQTTLKQFSKHVSAQLTKLVLPHQITEIQNGKNLEHTMPTRGGDHCILSVDIVGSSKVEHPYFGKAVERFQSRCWKILNDKYDPQLRQGEAYRIKEMGDGFLASIGFPLNFPEDQNELETAHQIAIRCMEAFDEEMKILNYHKPIYCAAGIAWGYVEGYFPIEYPVAFDLRGRGIVLATRYQELRKALDDVPRNHHLILVSQSFFLGLSEASRARYEKIQFPRNFSMRDDESARVAYLLAIPSSQNLGSDTLHLIS